MQMSKYNTTVFPEPGIEQFPPFIFVNFVSFVVNSISGEIFGSQAF